MAGFESAVKSFETVQNRNSSFDSRFLGNLQILRSLLLERLILSFLKSADFAVSHFNLGAT